LSRRYEAGEPGLGRRIAWFVALWSVGVAALGAVSLAIRAALSP
jgi:hypothetical protein